MATLTLGPVQMHGQQASGAGYFFTKLTDWYSLPDSKASSDPIPQGHGSFDAGEDWSSSAIISVEGYLRGTDRSEALRMQSVLNTVRSIEDLSTMTLDDVNGAEWRRVSVKRVKLGDIGSRRFVEFSIDVEATDPFRYGELISVSTGLPSISGGITFPITFPIDFGVAGSPGRVVTTNSGEQPTYSLFEVTGGLAGGFSLVEIEDGREIRFEFPIALGSTAYVDPVTGRAWIDNPSNELSGFLTKSEWWTTPPHGFRTIQFNPIGAVTGAPIFTARTAPANL